MEVDRTGAGCTQTQGHLIFFLILSLTHSLALFELSCPCQPLWKVTMHLSLLSPAVTSPSSLVLCDLHCPRLIVVKATLMCPSLKHHHFMFWKDSNGKGMLLNIWQSGFFSAHVTGSKALFLLHACVNDKDVRDPAAEMTSILPSCHSVPTACARKTAGDIDIYIQHTCQRRFCVTRCFLYSAGIPPKPQRRYWQTMQLKKTSDANFIDLN